MASWQTTTRFDVLTIAGYSNFNLSKSGAGNCRATLNDVTSENKASTESLIYFDEKEGKDDEKQTNTWWPRPSLKATCLQAYPSYLQSIQNDHDTSHQTQQKSTDLPYSDTIKASNIQHSDKRHKRNR